MKKLKVLELFGGIGAPRKALERLNIDCEIVDYVEIDKFAVKSYNAIFNENYEPQDVYEWNKNIDVDLIFHGSPCQDFSIAGDNKGGDIDSKTRSSLMWETIRIVEKLKPKYVIWENVKNVLSKTHKHNFDMYLDKLSELGYKNYYQVLNAKDYGIPQNRERVFVISILNGGEFNFPIKEELKIKLRDLLEETVDEKFLLNEEQIERMLNTTYESGTYDKRVQGDICRTLCARDYKDPKCVEIFNFRYDEGIRVKKDKDIMYCVVAALGEGGGLCQPFFKFNKEVRKLTPKECFRLMGFDDEDFEKAKEVNSNTQLYKQAGNSIVVNVLERIFENLLG